MDVFHQHLKVSWSPSVSDQEGTCLSYQTISNHRRPKTNSQKKKKKKSMIVPNINWWLELQSFLCKIVPATMISPPHILFFLLTLTLLTTVAKSYIIHSFCERTNHYTTTSSTYITNLNLLFSSLTVNTPKTGFSTAIAGDAPYRVYGLALCRGDINEDNCTSCLYTASRHIVRLCPYPNGGIVWYYNCGVRYSIRNFFSQLDTGNDYFAQYSQGGAADPFEFKQLLMSMMESISEMEAFNASVRMFVTGVNSRTYGMVQCTRDLSESDCFKCLNQTFYTLLEGCGSCAFGVAVKWNCIVMYSWGRIYNSDPTWVGLPELNHIELSPAPSEFLHRSWML